MSTQPTPTTGGDGMTKGMLFWVIWLFCLLSFAGVYFWGWPTIASGGVMLVLFGLIGWQLWGAPVK